MADNTENIKEKTANGNGAVIDGAGCEHYSRNCVFLVGEISTSTNLARFNHLRT